MSLIERLSNHCSEYKGLVYRPTEVWTIDSVELERVFGILVLYNWLDSSIWFQYEKNIPDIYCFPLTSKMWQTKFGQP